MSHGKRGAFGKRRDRVRYVTETIDRLVEGGYVTQNETGHIIWAEAAPTYLDLRSTLETHGDVSADWVSEVLDLDRAFTALMKDYPIGAVVVGMVMLGVDVDRLHHLIGDQLRLPAAKILDKSTAYMQAYLNGQDPKKAWHRGRLKAVA